MKYHEDKETASRYLSDMLSARECAKYERHIEECAECAAEVERYRRMMGLLRNLPQMKAPASLHAAVMEKISPGASEAPQRIGILRSWRFRAVAALLMLAAGAAVIFRLLEPTPHPETSGTHTAVSKNRAVADGDTAFLYNEKNVAAYMDKSATLFFGAAITTQPDAPGGYDVVALTGALNRVDEAAYKLDISQLKVLAAEDQKAFVDFAAKNGSPDIEKAQLKSPADNMVFMQMAQKRVVANAFERAASVDEVAPIIDNYNKATTQQQYVAYSQTRANAAPSGGGQAEGAPAPAASATPEAAPPQPAEAEKAKEDDRVAQEAKRELEALEHGKTGTEQNKPATGESMPALRDEAGRQRLQRRMDGDKQEVALNFRQSMVLFGVKPDGQKRPLNNTEKNDIKLVFDCLPTLENYGTDQFTPGGINVRLGEAEFLRLLKYLNDMADVTAAIGPIYSELLPAEPAVTGEMRNEAAEDPYAVDVQIIFE